MKKILLSVSMIAVAAVVVMGATGAFFSDTETSTGNTFTAGAIDLKVDSTQHYNGMICEPNTGGAAGTSGTYWWRHVGNNVPAAYPVEFSACGGTWGQNGGTDITSQQFFNFGDIKPGDSGEDTISLHVLNNDAYVCAAVSNLTNANNSTTGPEGKSPLNTFGGDLQKTMEWKVWNDNGLDASGHSINGAVPGDNIYQTGEKVLAEGNPSNGSLALYDSTTGAPLTGGQTAYLGVSWSLPSTSGNETQTDSLTGDISFNVVQSRNNGQFVCGQSQSTEGPKVGAKLSSYTAPTSCNITVGTGTVTSTHFNTIQAGVDAASADQKVCVDNGTYGENVDVNKSIILASVNGSSVTTINGRVRVGATGVTVKGFDITGANVSTEAGSSGIYVVGGSNNVTISDNLIDGTTQVATQNRGIHFEAGATTGATITNNVIKKWLQTGLFFNPTVGSITVTYNDFQTNNVGIGSDSLSNATVNNNEFNGNIVEAFGLGTPGAGNVAHENNFIPAGAGNNVNWYTSGSNVDATNNWWASEADGARTNDPTKVIVTSPAGSAFAHN